MEEVPELRLDGGDKPHLDRRRDAGGRSALVAAAAAWLQCQVGTGVVGTQLLEREAARRQQEQEVWAAALSLHFSSSLGGMPACVSTGGCFFLTNNIQHPSTPDGCVLNF